MVGKNYPCRAASKNEQHPIRVAHVMGKMAGGGVEAVVMNYYRHLDRTKVQFDFIVDEDSSRIPAEEIKDLGGRVLLAPSYTHLLAYQNHLRRLFENQGWRIVHSHINALSVFPLRAAKEAGVPIRVAHSHSTSGKGELARNAMKGILRQFSNVYPTHRFACTDHAGRWLFGPNSNYMVLHNAIDVGAFAFQAEKREEVRKELNISESAFVIGSVGRLSRQKNQLFLIDVFEFVKSKNPSSKLLLIGEGGKEGEIREAIRRKRLENDVLLLGQKDNIAQYYSAFDVFALPSLYEGLGMVAVEAQCAGLGCVLSDRVPEDADVSGDSAFLSLSESPEVWATAILKSENSRRTVLAPEKTILQEYDIEKQAPKLVEKYLEFYDLAVNQRC